MSARALAAIAAAAAAGVGFIFVFIWLRTDPDIRPSVPAAVLDLGAFLAVSAGIAWYALAKDRRR